MGGRTSLEQWRMLDALIAQGSYASASEQLYKSQSAINHAVQKLQTQLGVALVEVEGRRTRLTPAGEQLLRRARLLLNEATELEALAASLRQGQATELALAVENLFPAEILMAALERFSRAAPYTRIELYEEVLSGGEQRLLQGAVDLLISARVPSGFLGDPLVTLGLIAVAHPEHPLHAKAAPLTQADLRIERQLVVRDSGPVRDWNPGWLGAEQRWTFSHIRSSVAACCQGLGFSWYPEGLIADELADGRLKPLPLQSGSRRTVTLFLSYAAPQLAETAAGTLAELLRDELKQSDWPALQLPC